MADAVALAHLYLFFTPSHIYQLKKRIGTDTMIANAWAELGGSDLLF